MARRWYPKIKLPATLFDFIIAGVLHCGYGTMARKFLVMEFPVEKKLICMEARVVTRPFAPYQSILLRRRTGGSGDVEI